MASRMQPRCPRCGRRVVRRAPRIGALERLASRVFVYPFRCQPCGRRFRALTWGVRYTRRADDRREYDRVEVSLTATLVTRDDEQPARVTSLSVAGCLVETALEAPRGTQVRVRMKLPGADAPVNVDGAVVRWAHPGVLGIEFILLAAADRRRLAAFVLDRLGLREEHRVVVSDGGAARYARRRQITTTVLLLLTAMLAFVVIATLMPRFTLCAFGIDC